MAPPTPEDELLSILLVNLRNAADTFGEGTPPYESIRTTVNEHLQNMKLKGAKTNLTGVRSFQEKSEQSANSKTRAQQPEQPPIVFQSLPYRPKRD
ncbi:hypothetical protein LTR08_006977 [Meristemomyces frigidus]|nr:hypothetical protein LTR08_006977 [Meristemomyces frigidus]